MNGNLERKKVCRVATKLDLHPANGSAILRDRGSQFCGSDDERELEQPQVPHESRWPGRRPVLLGDRRRFSSHHRVYYGTSAPTSDVRNPAAKRLLVKALAAVAVFEPDFISARTLTARFSWIAALLLAAFVLSPMTAVAQSALPEIVVIVDTSQSMQYKLGEDVEPDCVKSERSRWTAVREMLTGTFVPYACSAETLPTHLDQATPPKQVNGVPTCIPGVKQSLFVPYKATPSKNLNQPIGDFSWKHDKIVSNLAELKFQADDNDVVLPYFAFDLSQIPEDQDWVVATISVFTMLPDKNGAAVEAYLGSFPYSPKTKSPREVVCDVTGKGFHPISPPTKVAGKSGFPTVFEINADEVKKLQAAKKAGVKEVYFTLIPVDFAFDASCSTVAKNVTPFELLFEGPATSKRPSLAVGVGKQCPLEGPDKHFQPTGVPLLNGLLDVFGPTAKFALMTADNTLGKAVDASGQYSYGGTLKSVWGDVNIGTQNPFNLLSTSTQMPHLDDLASRAARYKEITKHLADIRPSGGTPLGEMLADVHEYFGPSIYMDKHFQTVQDDPVNGDPFFQCRQRMVIVFTDGGANLAGGATNGRAAALAAANKLYANGVTVHVMAVGHPGKVGGAGQHAKDLGFLDDLASAGGSSSAVQVSSPKDVIDYMRPVLNATLANGEVLTRTHFTESTGLKDENLHSFQHKSIFQLTDPLLTSGLIEQRVFKCAAGCIDGKEPDRAGVCEVIDFEHKLKTRTVPRLFYTMKSGARYALSKASISADDMSISKTGLAPKLVPDLLTGSCATQSGTFNLADDGERDQYRDHLLEIIRGDVGSCRETVPLGAPARAQPVILEPASTLGIREPSFLSYKQAAITTPPYSSANPPGSFKRPTMLFAATHDGILHAFRTDKTTDIDVKGQLNAGDEMWTWLPGFNLRRARSLRLVSTANASYLGAAVVTGHFLLDRTGSSASEQALRWRSVVIGGAGEAGAGYFALDVTSPDEPELLWEVTPDRHCWGRSKLGASNGPNCASVTTFEEMGRSTALPVVANLYFDRNGTVKQRGVVILAGGKPPNDSDEQNFGVDGLGKQVVYVVNLENGQVIRKFLADDIDTTGMTAAIASKKEIGNFVSEPACFNNGPGQIVTRCFLGDDNGMVWRLDLSDTDPDKWALQFFHDAYSGSDTKAQYSLPILSTLRAPVLTKPSLATQRGGQLVVVYGTGGLDDATNAVRRHQVYSVTEKFTLTGQGVSARADFQANWALTLSDHTRFVGPPVIFGGNAYFASYTVSATGACKSGTAKIWGVDFNNRGQKNAANAPILPKGGFPVAGADPTKQVLVDHQTLGLYKPSPVDITPVPACIGGCSPGDANCVVGNASALSGAKPKYEVGVGVAGNTQAKTQKAKKGAQPKVGTINRALAAPRSTSVVTGWDLLLD